MLGLVDGTLPVLPERRPTPQFGGCRRRSLPESSLAVFSFARPAGATAALLAAAFAFAACGGGSEKGPAVADRPAGTVADSGFRPGQDGLPFVNYGDALSDGGLPSNMTAADVVKMFGQAVCADAQSRKCDLIPEAQDWLDNTNQAMSGGHCYGFSVLADLLWQGRVRAATFGATTVTGLQISDNAALQRQIAYDWALQTLPSVQSHRITGSPNKILLALMTGLKRGAAQAYTIVLWKRDGTGGHAVTPYAVESRGSGKFSVLIYDNNWPDRSRSISFDTHDDTWSYDASTLPGQSNALYEGDASTKTIALDPSTPGLGTQPCPFCGKVPKKGTTASSGRSNLAFVTATGTAPHLVVADEAGRQLGYMNGRLVNQIPGAYDAPVVSNNDWDNQASPDFYLPADRRYTYTLDGSRLSSVDHESINIDGPNYDVRIGSIVIGPGERDTLTVDPAAAQLSFTSPRPETPAITVGVSDARADYSFELTGLSEGAGGTINLAIPAEGATLDIATVGTTSTVGLKMKRETERGTQNFQAKPVVLVSGDRATLQFGQWTDPAQAEPLAIVHGGATSTLTDKAGT